MSGRFRRATWLLSMVLVALAIGAGLLPAVAHAKGDVPPKIVYTAPYAGMPSGWGGETVIITFDGATHGGKPDPVSAAGARLWINGKECTTCRKAISTSTYGTSIEFSRFPMPGAGTTGFRVELRTESGQTAQKSWTFQTTGSVGAAGHLIDFQLMKQWFGYILKGAPIALYVAVIASVLSIVFGLLGALGRLSRTMSFREAWNKHRSWAFMVSFTVRRVPYWVATLYASVFRGTPLLLQIYVVYYAVPAFIQFARGHWAVFDSVPYPSAIVSGIAALSLNYGAYVTEVIRGGILAVPRGQREAAWALGMKSWLTQRRVILPQAFRIIVPTLGNYFISMIKDTSLLSVIAVTEILKRSQLVGSRFGNFMSPLIVAALIYWVMTIFCSFWQGKLESKLARDRGREQGRTVRKKRAKLIPQVEDHVN